MEIIYALLGLFIMRFVFRGSIFLWKINKYNLDRHTLILDYKNWFTLVPEESLLNIEEHIDKDKVEFKVKSGLTEQEALLEEEIIMWDMLSLSKEKSNLVMVVDSDGEKLYATRLSKLIENLKNELIFLRLNNTVKNMLDKIQQEKTND